MFYPPRFKENIVNQKKEAHKSNPKKDESRQKAIEEIRKVLVLRREALVRALHGDMALLHRFQPGHNGDMCDAAMEEVCDSINSQLAESESKELVHIDHALEKIRTGEYGICEGEIGEGEKCGVKIPLVRINAMPYTAFCIDCQRNVERHGPDSDGRSNYRALPEPSDDEELTMADFEQGRLSGHL